MNWNEFIRDNQPSINQYYVNYHSKTIERFGKMHLVDKGVPHSPDKVKIDKRNLRKVTRLCRLAFDKYVKTYDIPLCDYCGKNEAFIMKPTDLHTVVIADVDAHTMFVCKKCNKYINHKERTGIWYIGTPKQSITWWLNATNETIPNWALATLLGYSTNYIYQHRPATVVKYNPNARTKRITYLDAGTRQRISQYTLETGIQEIVAVNKALDLLYTYGSLSDIIARAGIVNDKLIVPPHIEHVIQGIYYDSDTYTYVRYDVEAQEFVPDLLVPFLQEALGSDYAYFWARLLEEES